MDKKTAQEYHENNFLIFLASFNIFLSLFCGAFLKTYQGSMSGTVKNQTGKEKTVLGDKEKLPRIYISTEKDEYSTYNYGVLSLSSADEPAINVSAYNYSGEVEISIYQANQGAILDFLTHDKDNKRLKKKPDISKLKLITSLKQSVDGKEKADEKKVLLPLEESGAWFLQVKTPQTEDYTCIIRSDYGVLLKEGDDRFIFWAQSFKTKRKLSGGSIKVYNLLGKATVLDEALFDGDGIASVIANPKAKIAIADVEGKVSLVPMNLKYLESEDNWIKFSTKEIFTSYFTFTDRPLYQPGDTIYFKAVLRDDDDGRYSLPVGTADVKIYKGWDEKKDPICEKSLVISGNGTINGQCKLPKDADVGNYHLKIKTERGNEETTFFQVQYYRKPEYFLEIETTQEELTTKDKLVFTLKGAYFSGQPTAGLKVKYSVASSDFYNYGYLSDYHTPDDDYYWWPYGEKTLESNEVILNENGEARIEINTDNSSKGKNRIFTASAEINDGSGNPAFARKNFLVYAGGFDIFRKDYSYGSQIGKELIIPLVLKPHFDQSVSQIPLKVKIHRENWTRRQVSSKDKPIYRYEKEEENLPDLNLQTDSRGEASISFTPTKAGSYNFSVEASDGRGNLIEKSFYSWVTDKDYAFRYDEKESRLTIKADKAKYEPGENVNLTISSEIPDRDVFLSFERGRVDRYQVISLNGTYATVRGKLSETDLPNVFAEVSSFSDSSLDSESIDIVISTQSKKIVVSLLPDRVKYDPGGTVTLNVQTADTAGNPVSAEVAVWAVDKALFELVEQKPGKIFDRFWSERYHYTSRAYSLEGIVVYRGGGAERGGGGGGEARTVFKDAAYWNPAVQTDNFGRAKIAFKLPDNLTTWVIAGIASSNETRVGQNTKEIVVTKNVIVRPILPNIMRIDDKTMISALVQNFTEATQSFKVELNFDSGNIEGPKSQEIFIDPKEARQVLWWIKPQRENEKAKLTFSVVSKEVPENSDKVVMEIPVWKFGFWEKKGEVGEGAKNYLVSLGGDVDKEKSKITLFLSSNLTGSLFSAMKYLVDYPYGCVEQTTSRFVPAVIAQENPQLFGTSISDKNIGEMIKEGIKRLEQLQLSNGGWGWWYSNEHDLFITSYVVEYLFRAKNSGYSVSDEMLDRVKIFLDADYRQDNIEQEKEKNILASQVSKAYAYTFIKSDKSGKLISSFEGLTPDILSLAVMANVKNGNKNPETNGLNKLMSLVKNQGENLYWEAGEKGSFGSKEASTALAIRAMLVAGEDRNTITKAVRFLTKNRSKEYWANSFATAQTIQALVDYSLTENESTQNYQYFVELDGEEIDTGRISQSNQKIGDIKILAEDIKTSGSVISIRKEGDGQIYSTLLTEEFHTDKEAKTFNHGLKVRREYLDENGNTFKEIGVGDLVEVRISLDDTGGAEGEYAVVTDELPAGLIPVNRRFKNEQYNESNSGKYDYLWWSDPEFTKNGAIFPIYRVSTETPYSYWARAVSEGTLAVPPVEASIMYSPEIWGRSEAGVITIAKSKEVLPKPVGKLVPSKALSRGKFGPFSIVVAVIALCGIGLVARKIYRKKESPSRMAPPSDNFK